MMRDAIDRLVTTRPGFEVPQLRIPGVHPDTLDIVRVSRHVSTVNQRDDRVAANKQVVERNRDLVAPFDIGRVLQLGMEPIVFVRLEALDVSTEERVGRLQRSGR